MQPSEFKGPLAGINVIDFGHYYAGPMTGMLLADQGADVIRIVKPGDRELPEQQYRLLNRNKKLLTLDLKTPEGRRQAESLIERADVVIENFRPGAMKRLGLDYASVKNKNPRLVYLSLPGFASTDKERAHVQAWEGVLGAAAGMYTMGFNQVMGFSPVYTSVPHCSAYGAMSGAIGILAALTSRENHGFGTLLETPLVDAGLQGRYDAMAMTTFGDLQKPHPFNQPSSMVPDVEKLKYSTQKGSAKNLENLSEAFWSQIIPPGYAPFICADGRKVFIWGLDIESMCRQGFQALGIERQLLQEGFVYAGVWEMGLDNNLNHPSMLSRERRHRLIELMSTAMISRPAEEWEYILRKAGLCCGMIRSRDEFLMLEPMLEAGVITKMDNGKTELTVPGSLADVRGPGDQRFTQYSEEAKFIAFTEAQALFDDGIVRKHPGGENPTLKKGDLLKDLKVLELGSFISVPYASYVLAQFGAEVIKSDWRLAIPHFLWHPMEQNQSKRSLLTDLSTVPGQQILRELIKNTDIVLHNIRDGLDVRIGVDQKRIKQINPNAISAQFCALGGPLTGSWDGSRGIEPVAPCITGLWAHYGGGVDSPLLHGGTDSSDIPGGLAMAFASLLAIYQKRVTGYAGAARSSLVRGTCFYQLPWMIAENGSSDWGEARGQFAVGESWWQRLYASRNGWIYVGASEACKKRLAEIVVGAVDADEEALEAAFARGDSAFWEAKLNDNGIGCHRVQTFNDICTQHIYDVGNEIVDDAIDGSFGVLRYVNHPSGIPVNVKAPSAIRVGEDHNFRHLAPCHTFGQDTKKILLELGYAEEEITTLIHLGIVREFLPELGGKDQYFYDHSQSL